MSVAFTREESAEAAAEFQLPDRPISPHANFVTASGLKALEVAMTEARAAYNIFQQFEDANERRRASAAALRDMNYFAERLRSAQLVSTSLVGDALSFGNYVTVKRKNGRRQSYRIVGEDEADPRRGTLSYASPLARVLMGKVVGDLVQFGEDEIEVLLIERQAD